MEMTDFPSSERRKHVLQLVKAIIAPWLLVAIAIAPALVSRELYRAGWMAPEWMGGVLALWFFGLSIVGLLLSFGLIILGVWRLIRYRQYRHSQFGWIWIPIMWGNAVVLALCMEGIQKI